MDASGPPRRLYPTLKLNCVRSSQGIFIKVVHTSKTGRERGVGMLSSARLTSVLDHDTCSLTDARHGPCPTRQRFLSLLKKAPSLVLRILVLVGYFAHDAYIARSFCPIRFPSTNSYILSNPCTFDREFLSLYHNCIARSLNRVLFVHS